MKILYYLILFCLSTVVTVHAQNDDWRFIEMLNQYRIENGLEPVQISEELTDLAKTHSTFLVEKNTFADGEYNGIIIVNHSSYGKIENLNTKITFDSNFDAYSNDFMRWINSMNHNNNMLQENVKYVGYANEISSIKNRGLTIFVIFSVLLLE